MKLMNKYIRKSLVLAVIAAAGFAMISCEDEPDKYEVAGGVPTVRYIRSPKASASDSLIVAATTGSSICLVGDNLRSIYELYFNDKKAVLNNSFMTDHTMIVDVPQTIPTLVSNKIYMVPQSKDTVTYDFEVTVPAPTLTAMSCEYAPVGSEVSIIGNYFVDDPNVPLLVTLPGNVEVKDFTSISQSSISFVMPECSEEGTIDVTTIYGTTTSTFHYLDTRGMLFDFDGVTGLGNHGWHARDIISDATSISGKFVQLGDGTSAMTEDGAWDDTHFAFEYWCGSWDTPQNVTSGDGIALHNLVDFTDYVDMSLKFEMYVPSTNPWSAGAMQICFEGYDKVTISGYAIEGYNGTIAGPNAKAFNGEDGLGDYGRALYRPWTTNGSFDTGDSWITVTIPLKNFNYTRQGAMATEVPSSPGDFASLTFFVVGGGVNGTECTPIIKLDNIRAVPNK